MAEGFINQTEGSGKKAHTFQRTIGANTVEDQVVIAGLPYHASYSCRADGVSVATANDHVYQLMAGSSLNVYVVRIRVWQRGLATTAATTNLDILRLTTAGTGGAASTIERYDTTDAAAGAAGINLPTAKGTEGGIIDRIPLALAQAAPITTLPATWEPPLLMKPIRIAAGTSNGIAIKSLIAVAVATVNVEIAFFEANF